MPTLKNDVTAANETAIVGTSAHHHGVAGESKENGAGLVGVSVGGEGVSGYSTEGPGIVGQSDQKTGVRGLSKPGPGVEGVSERGDGVRGTSDSGAGVSGRSGAGHGVVAQSDSGSGVRAVSKSGRGVEGWSESSYGVSGDSASSAGVRGTSANGRGIEGWSTRSEGVFGISDTGTGVWGVAGRSRFAGLTAVDDIGGLFRAGVAARDWAAAMQPPAAAPDLRAREASTPAHGTHDAPPADVKGAGAQAASLALGERPSAASDVSAAHRPESPVAGAVFERPDASSVADVAALAVDESAGIGVYGEHRAAGIGVKAVSRAGMGLAAYSTEHEAVHAETHSPVTAAIAAFNLNRRATGAAIYAKKEGPRGHAGFFDGRVWVSGELGVGGDVVLANADCAEDFDVADTTAAEPGTVMTIGDDGVLQPSCLAYDRCVVGVVSGAGTYRPALVLDKQPSCEARSPVALLGKVFCKVSAAFGAIEPGDLLTTSPLPGHAMKASDPARAFGAVIGKALRPLREGEGLIPIVIALQ